jgi:tetratricopeptide (TPR) repeat protein
LKFGKTLKGKSAEEYARDALQLCATLPEALDVLGRGAFNNAQSAKTPADFDKSLSEARRFCTDALACGAENKSTLNEIIGETYAAQKDFMSAEESFSRAARYCPPDGSLWKSYAQLANMTGDYSGFTASLKTAISAMKQEELKYELDLEAARAILARLPQ